MSATLSIRSGSIYLSADDYDVYFRGLDAVIVIIRNNELHILPVQQVMAGGYILKIRGANGDRVVSAPDVFIEHDLMDWRAQSVEATWCADRGALICPIPRM